MAVFQLLRFQFAQAAFLQINRRSRAARRQQRYEPAQKRFVTDNQNIFRRGLQAVQLPDQSLRVSTGN